MKFSVCLILMVDDIRIETRKMLSHLKFYGQEMGGQFGSDGRTIAPVPKIKVLLLIRILSFFLAMAFVSPIGFYAGPTWYLLEHLIGEVAVIYIQWGPPISNPILR